MRIVVIADELDAGHYQVRHGDGDQQPRAERRHREQHVDAHDEQHRHQIGGEQAGEALRLTGERPFERVAQAHLVGDDGGHHVVEDGQLERLRRQQQGGGHHQRRRRCDELYRDDVDEDEEHPVAEEDGAHVVHEGDGYIYDLPQCRLRQIADAGDHEGRLGVAGEPVVDQAPEGEVADAV